MNQTRDHSRNLRTNKILKCQPYARLFYLLTEQGIIFERTVSAILVDPFQEKLLLEILAQFEEGGRRSYPKAVEATIVHHGLGQGQDKPDRRSGADRSPKFLGHDETSTPVF